MAGYDDTKKMIISTLMGRPNGEEISPEKQQEYELNMLEYIRSLELLANAPIIGIAKPSTQPVQPNNSRACYIAGVGDQQTVTFQNFYDYLGNKITVTNGREEASLAIFIWNGQYWSVEKVSISVKGFDGTLLDVPGSSDSDIMSQNGVTKFVSKTLKFSNLIVDDFAHYLRAKSVKSFDFFTGGDSTILYRLSVLGYFEQFKQVIFSILDQNLNEIVRWSVNVTSQPIGIQTYTYSNDASKYYCKVVIDWNEYSFPLTDSLGKIRIIAQPYESQYRLLSQNGLSTKYDSMKIANKGLLNYPTSSESILKAIREIRFYAVDTSKVYGIQVLGWFPNRNGFQFTIRDNTTGTEVKTFSFGTGQTAPTSGCVKYENFDDNFIVKIVMDYDLYTSGYLSTTGALLLQTSNYNDYSKQQMSLRYTGTTQGFTLTGNNQFNLYRRIFPVIDVKLWVKDGVGLYAFTNMATRVNGQTFFTINDKEKNIEILRLAVTESLPTGIKTYEKYDPVNNVGFRIVYDWSKTIYGSTGSDGNMQIEIAAQPYTSMERMMYNGKLLSSESDSFTEIVASRNSNNYNSIRDIMSTLSPTSSNRYKILIPKGRWCETDIQGKQYVELVGEDMYETVLYINGNDSNVKTPSNYSYVEYSNKTLNQIPQQYKHIIFVKYDLTLRNVTLEADNAKYCIHIDSNLTKHQVDVKNCVLTDKGGVNYCVGIGIRPDQNLIFDNCKFIRPNTDWNGVFIHNWNNESGDSLLKITNSKFIGCGFLMLSELGSGRNDIVNLINCYSDKNNADVKIMVDNTSSGTTYYTNPTTGEKETDPTKVPYSLKLNCLSSNVQKIIWVPYAGTPATSSNPRPDFINRSITTITNFGN